MTFEEAWKIFKIWQEYQEILNKLYSIFSIVPESFLPYSIDTLEEALNIVAKYYFDGGDQKASKNIQESMGAYLTAYYFSPNDKLEVTDTMLTDEQVLTKMKRDLDFMIEHPDLLKAKLDSLKRIKESWEDFRKTGVPTDTK